jgi:carbonic anhydrase
MHTPATAKQKQRAEGERAAGTNVVTELLERNARFAETNYEERPILPRLRAVVLTCGDSRVDPAHLLGLEHGDAGVIRNGGGRITPETLQILAILGNVRAAEGAGPEEFELILMQHTDCGISHLFADGHLDLLASYFGVTPEELPGKSPGDPYEGVRGDIKALADNPLIPASLSVTGLVYDVESGRAELIERLSPLRDE